MKIIIVHHTDFGLNFAQTADVAATNSFFRVPTLERIGDDGGGCGGRSGRRCVERGFLGAQALRPLAVHVAHEVGWVITPTNSFDHVTGLSIFTASYVPLALLTVPAHPGKHAIGVTVADRFHEWRVWIIAVGLLQYALSAVKALELARVRGRGERDGCGSCGSSRG